MSEIGIVDDEYSFNQDTDNIHKNTDDINTKTENTRDNDMSDTEIENIEKKIYFSTMKEVVELLNQLEEKEKDPYYCLQLSESERKIKKSEEREKKVKKEQKLQNKKFKKNVTRNRTRMEKQTYFENEKKKEGFLENVTDFQGKKFSERDYYAKNRKTFNKSDSNKNKTRNNNKGEIKPLKKVKTRPN